MLVLILLSCISFRSLSAYEDPRETYCTESASTYASNSAFSSNLALSLAALKNSTALSGFSTAASSAATALALCRVSISSSECQECIDAAVIGVLDVCPNRTSAQVWYTNCMVRYSNTNFLNQSDNTNAFMLYDPHDAPNQTIYDFKVNLLLQNLSYNAGLNEKRSAVGRTSISKNNYNVYGYVDCTRDVSGRDCTVCLLNAIGRIPSCCLGKWAGWIATPTCNIQFNMNPIDHDDWINNPPYISTDLNSLAVSPVGDLNSLAVSPVGQVRDSGNSSGSKIVLMFVLVVTIIVIVAALIIMVVAVIRRRDKNKEVIIRRVEEQVEDVNNNNDYDIDARSFMYDYDVLAAATDNFSMENLLGDGGFGTVYRMVSGEEIAVKRMKAGSRQGGREFSNEVRLLLKMQHRNLVQLIGCCAQGDELMLIYEYLPNKSLDCFLFDKSKSALLDWAKRWKIITGVARGLIYLHEDSQLKTIHRDIKASNILLDQQMNPKISDFGIAKLFDDGQSCLRTGRIVGTFGYMAPEYAIRGMVSTKGDVFSFGILMLEILSGRKNYDVLFDDEQRVLLNLTKRLDREGRYTELIDVTIGDYPPQDVLRCIKIGLLCCQERVRDRPTMSLVLTLLTSHSITLPCAGRVAYQGGRDNTDVIENPSQDDSSGNNTITISLAEGR